MEYRNSLQQFRQDVVRGSFLARPIPRSGLTSVPVHVGGGLGLQVPPCVLHRLEVGRDFHQRDADAAELADVDKILDGFHQYRCEGVGYSDVKYSRQHLLEVVDLCKTEFSVL